MPSGSENLAILSPPATYPRGIGARVRPLLIYTQRGKRNAQDLPANGRGSRKRTRAENNEYHSATDRQPDATVDFEQVSQDEQKHMILEFPRGTGEWYIL